MGEQNPIKDTAEAVRGVVEAVPIYQDLLQPAMREVGKGLETIAKAIVLALEPLRGLVVGYETTLKIVSRRLTEKLRDVPPDRIVTPSPSVVGPAMEALRFTGQEEELREMYASLLASSLDKQTAHIAHPAFVDIIKNLSPDEARIMRTFAQVGAIPLINVRLASQRSIMVDGGMYMAALRHVSTVGQEAGCDHPELVPSYLDNLDRLGLIALPGQGGRGGPRCRRAASGGSSRRRSLLSRVATAANEPRG